jgi:multimeric flavodoxin WrbA
MKVLGLIGSPRRNSNTDLLVTEILNGAADAGCQTEKVYLYPQNIGACTDCRGCKKGKFVCKLQDDMANLYPKLEAADVVVFGTPLYWYGSSAKMKLLQDRLRPYIASKKLRGKRAVLVIPSEEGADACQNAVGMFRQSFVYLEMQLVNVVLPKAAEKAEVKAQPQLLREARQIGKNLV